MAIISTKTHVEINGVDVSSYIVNWQVPERLNITIEEASILLAGNISEALTLNNEQTVLIQRGKTDGTEETIFRGFVKMHSPKGATVEVIAENKLGQLGRRQVTNTYDKDVDPQAGILSEIAEDIITTYGGLTAAVTDSTASSRPLDVYICNRDNCLERIERLREVLDWVLRYDHENDNAIFEPKGNSEHPSVLRYNISGSSNVHNTPKWDIDSEGMVNRVEVVGRPLEDLKTELFSGDAAETTFTLAETPLQTEVFISGVKKILGVTDSTSTFDYTVKQHLKQIIFTSPPASDTNNIEVNYGVFRPISITLEDNDSIETYCPDDPLTGEKLPFEKTYKMDDVVTVADAEKRAEEILAHLAQPIKSAVLEVDHQTTTIRAGMSIRVVDEVNGFDERFIVEDVDHRWPEPVDLVSVGQERIFQKNTLIAIEDRLKKVEKRELRNIDLVLIRKDSSKDVRVYGYNETQLRDVTVDGAWGKGFGDGVGGLADYTWGETGAIWQNAYTNSPTKVAIVWPGDKAEEDFTDDNLIDTGTSTSTIDTSTDFDVTFGSPAETLILGPVHMGIGGTTTTPQSINVLNVRVPAERISGSFDTVEVSSDNASTWETITGDVTLAAGTDHTFGTPGPTIWLRFTAANTVLSGKDADQKIQSAVITTVVS